jgi:Na+-transporting methylmalonyl-CoA/oxaloacetate decarboxylase gamma subunit
MILLAINSETWTITILGWLIVFAALIFLVGIFLLIPKIIKWITKRTLRNQARHTGKELTDDSLMLTGEMNAAISMALFLYFNEIHEDESNVITIKEVKRRYSPWSSKLYGMNNMNFPR